MNKKIVVAGLLGALLLGGSFGDAPAEAADANQPAAATEAKKAQVYAYTSPEYGFSILCPKKPNVIPASVLYEGKKGEILIFDNEEYQIKHAWVILLDAFDNKAVPDLNKLSEKEAEEQLKKLQKSYGYEGIALLNISDTNKAIFAVTAKEVEIDTNGDGTPDETATADTQMAVSFFRGPKGGCYSIQLIDNPVLRPESVSDFQLAVSTFREAGDSIGKPEKK